MADLPGSITLNSPSDDSTILASDRRNDASSIQTAVNALISFLTGGTSGKTLVWSDSDSAAHAYPPGYEYAHTQKTTSTSVTATSEATADTVVTASEVTFDGSTVVLIEAFAPYVRQPGAAVTVSVYLYDGASSVGRLAVYGEGTNSQYLGPLRAVRRLTPSAGAHTYSIRASVASGTGTVAGGAGGSTADMPAFIRITKV